MENKIKYILPDFMCFGRNSFLIELYEKYPEVVKENSCIYSFFGTFPNAIWNGGSIMFNYRNYNIDEMKKVRDFYNNRGIVITFTFTNLLIKEEHLNDEYCNNIMKIFNNGMNEVLVSSPILEKYIRETYPRYKINRSIIATEKVPFLAKDYHLTVMSKFKNKDFVFIDKLTIEDRKKTELLCNEFCINNCPYAYEHYREYAYLQIYGNSPKNSNEKYGKCRYDGTSHDFFCNRWKNSNYIITWDDINNIYVPLGFQYFKISGRGEFNLLTNEMLMMYLIKEKYQMDVRTYINERMLHDFRKATMDKLTDPIIADIINSKEYEYV